MVSECSAVSEGDALTVTPDDGVDSAATDIEAVVLKDVGSIVFRAQFPSSALEIVYEHG